MSPGHRRPPEVRGAGEEAGQPEGQGSGRDRDRAAERAAERRAAAVIAQLSVVLARPNYFHPGEVPGPIGDRLREWGAAGSGTPMCPHLGRPQVVMGMLYRPGPYWCARCFGPVMKRDTEVRPEVCDGCLTSGHATFREHTIQSGPTLLWGNVCDGCSTAAGVTS